MRGRITVVVLVAGCGRLDFEATQRDADTRDATPPCMQLGPWGTPIAIAEINSSGGLGPAISPDELAIYFQPNNVTDIVVATRATKTGTFSTPVTMAALDGNAADRDPVIAANGTHLYYTSDRMSPTHDSMYRSSGAGAVFGSPTLIAELGSDVFGPWVSNDELEVVYGGTTMRHASRSSADALWGAPTALGELDPGGFPSLSADGLTIYFETRRTGRAEIYTATRPGLALPFGAPAPVAELNAPFLADGDPELSRDGLTMYFDGDEGGGHAIYRSNRTCL